MVSNLVAYWDFSDDALDKAPDGVQSDDGVLNGALLVGGGLDNGAIHFGGNGDVMELATSADINQGFSQRTISLWFHPDDVNASGRQVIYQQGGPTRGMNIYIENGNLFAGAWDLSSSWAGTWLTSSNISSVIWNHVVFVFDTILDVMKITTNGSESMASISTVAMPGHSPGRIGSSPLGTRFADGTGGSISSFQSNSYLGYIDEIRYYSDALAYGAILALGGDRPGQV